MRHSHTPLSDYFANFAGFMIPIVLCGFFYIGVRVAGSLSNSTNSVLRVASDVRVLAGFLAVLIAIIAKIAFRIYRNHPEEEMRIGALGVLQGCAFPALFLLLSFFSYFLSG